MPSLRGKRQSLSKKSEFVLLCLQHNVTDDALEPFHTNVSLLIRMQVIYEVYGSLFQVKRPGESTPPPMQLSDDPNIRDTPQLAKYTP